MSSFSRLLTVLVVAAVLAGCSGSGDNSQSTPERTRKSTTTTTATTSGKEVGELAWDQVDLEGDLVDIQRAEPSECGDAEEFCGAATISNAEVVTGSGDKVPTDDIQIFIDPSTDLFGCGPTDATVPITFDDLLALPGQVEGDIPTSVWAVDGVDGVPRGPIRAAHLVTGSCG